MSRATPKPGVRPGCPTTGLQSHRHRRLSQRNGLSGVAGRARVDDQPFWNVFLTRQRRRNVTTRTSRWPAREASNGATGVTPCATRWSSTSAASQGSVSVNVPMRSYSSSARGRRRSRCSRGGRADEDPIDAVAMHASGVGCPLASAAPRCGTDALDVPNVLAHRGLGTSRLERREEAIAPAQDRRHRRARGPSSAIGSNHRSTPPKSWLAPSDPDNAVDAAGAQCGRSRRSQTPCTAAADTGRDRRGTDRFRGDPSWRRTPANQSAARTTPAPPACRPGARTRTPTPGAIGGANRAPSCQL